METRPAGKAHRRIISDRKYNNFVVQPFINGRHMSMSLLVFDDDVRLLACNEQYVVIEDEVVACFGLTFDSEGVYKIWAIISDEARGHGRLMIKFMRSTIASAYEKLGIHRLTAVVRADMPEYSRFIELLGFDYEGTMRKASPNKTDLKVYGRLK